MSFPQIPEGLPSSSVVIGHFSAFCRDYPRASVAQAPRDQMAFFKAYLSRSLPEDQVTLILRRSEYPL